MKLTKTELKAIIKECLIEILTDSVGVQAASSPRSVKSNFPALREAKNNKIEKQTQDNIRAITAGNPIMEQIFQDTAKNTVPAQMNAEGRKNPIGAIEQVIENVEPNEIFGNDMINNWATLANLLLHIDT